MPGTAMMPILDTLGRTVAFSRFGVTTPDPSGPSLLALAEANAIPAVSGCRIGACFGCRADLLSGSVRYEQQPLEQHRPAALVLCYGPPGGDVVLAV